jgi:hypothetical protein
MQTSPPHVAKVQSAEYAPAFNDVLSTRAKRRLAILLRMRLLELREEGLDRVRAVITRRLSVDELLQDHNPLPHDGGKTVPER